MKKSLNSRRRSSTLQIVNSEAGISSNVRSKTSFAKNKYRLSTYEKILQKDNFNEKTKDQLVIEVEGIRLHSRGNSKGIFYFECCSHRQRNAPLCDFRARIVNFDPSKNSGNIEISSEHSETCKYQPGNETTYFAGNTELNANKLVYKKMKIEIEKKLEEEDWSTPAEILKWILANFSIQNHLSYSHVDEIVQTWRRKNIVSKESYIFSHNKNKAGLPFLRSYFRFEYKKNNTNEVLKIVIWGSDFQVNRLRLTNHLFIDGTFTVVPCGYLQLVTFAIRDPNTGYVKPGLWALLNSKDEESYHHLFQIVKYIASSSGTNTWRLESATLDFEVAAMNAFRNQFPNARIVGCLFHFKQALYREAQRQGIVKEDMREETKVLISKLGTLSWKGDLNIVEKELRTIEEKYMKTMYNDLIVYYKNNWLSKLKNGLIDYSAIDDDIRSNSVLEQYHSHIKNLLPRAPTWPKFIEFLINEEVEYVNNTFLAEQKENVAVKSVNFDATYLPKPLRNAKNKNNNNSNSMEDSYKNDNSNLENTNKRRIEKISPEIDVKSASSQALKKSKLNYQKDLEINDSNDPS